MIFIISSIIIAFIATINYRKGFLLYLLFQMIWFPDTQVFKIGDSSVNINFIMAMFFVFLYIIRSRGIIKLEGERFPYKVPMVFIAFSLFITCFYFRCSFTSNSCNNPIYCQYIWCSTFKSSTMVLYNSYINTSYLYNIN